MTYVALLRGINVGGQRKVEMARLKATFENAGMKDVATYINSGNVIFTDTRRRPETIRKKLEDALKDEFGFEIKALIRDPASIQTVVRALRDGWTNDSNMKCDVVFLGKQHDRKSVLDEIKVRSEIEDVVYVPGAIVWRIDRKNATRSGLQRMIGTGLYKEGTVRNCNTVRKLAELMA